MEGAGMHLYRAKYISSDLGTCSITIWQHSEDEETVLRIHKQTSTRLATAKY